jgi:hypothetical protein
MKKAVAAFAAIMLVGMTGAMARAQVPYNNDINGTELSNFNHFLDNHPEVSQQLAANPGLVNNPAFLNNHPGLQNFLNNHPGVNQELHQTPGQFMYREGHYEWNHGGGPVASGPGQGNNYGITHGEVSRFDNGYLDEHPEVARQLGANPGLVDNPQFLATHPGLDQYFANHPEIRSELQQHPDRFMNDEWKHEAWQNGAHPLATTDHYMDTHPQVSQQLEKDPALVDNKQYVDSHPGLHDYLNNHPVARAEWQSHPNQYMNRENHYQKKH